MANIDTQKLMKFDELTSEQKEELKTRFLERKRELEAALKTVNGSLEALEKKPQRLAPSWDRFELIRQAGQILAWWWLCLARWRHAPST